MASEMTDERKVSVHLGTDEAEFESDGECRRLPCDVVLETEPRPRLVFRVAGLDTFRVWLSQQRFSVHIVRADVRCDAFLTSTSNGIVGLSPQREPIVVGQSENLTEIEFDLINFPEFWAMSGPSTRLPENHLDMVVAGWRMEIRPPRTSPEVDALRSTLHSVTHTCTLQKSDQGAFTSEEAHNFLNVIHDVMSFAAGRWVAPVLVRGFDRDRQIRWEEWGTRPLHPNLGRIETWFDTHHAQELTDTLSGASELRKDSNRAKTFHSALYWYLRSSGLAAGVDGGIILLQAALELLSWHIFVTERKALSREGFGKLPADDQLRLLIESCGIPTGIPSGLADLTSTAKELNWNDGPKALAAVRNLLVHPGKQREVPYYDAWRLAEWYVELVLLRMLSFSGEYSDRTKAQRWVGAVEPVPWAKP
ncbi:MAG TPA: hypothetical protein VK419_13325 [Bryobacteraceae bacterium]|nr:hypothetical protein [Bryobacteraceae bacterium]